MEKNIWLYPPRRGDQTNLITRIATTPHSHNNFKVYNIVIESQSENKRSSMECEETKLTSPANNMPESSSPFDPHCTTTMPNGVANAFP